MSPEYLAGFVDGEGCIDAQRMYPQTGGGRRIFYCRPRLRVAQATPGIYFLQLLQRNFGGNLTYREGKGNQQSSASWEFLDKAGLARFLSEIEPYMFVKREQARLVLWWLDSGMSGRQTRQGYPRMEEARMAFADELKLMKLDPQRLSEVAVSRIEALVR